MGHRVGNDRDAEPGTRHVVHLHAAVLPHPDWWFDPASGGGWLGASRSHRIDALRQWFGEIEAVSAGLPSLSDPALPVDDSFDIRCVTRSRIDVSLVQSARSIGPAFSTNRIAGTAGTLWSESGCVRIAVPTSPKNQHIHRVPHPLPNINHNVSVPCYVHRLVVLLTTPRKRHQQISPKQREAQRATVQPATNNNLKHISKIVNHYIEKSVFNFQLTADRRSATRSLRATAPTISLTRSNQ